MINKNDPEIQIYLEEELQKQREQILERIIWRNRYFPIFNSTYENLEYYTGASMEKIEEIIEKCQWKARYQRTYDRTRLLARVGCAWYLIKMQQLDDDLKAVKNGIVIEALKEWRKDPDKYAVMELVCHNIPEEYIVNELDLTYDKLRELYPTDEIRHVHNRDRDAPVSEQSYEAAVSGQRRTPEPYPRKAGIRMRADRNHLPHLPVLHLGL